MKKKSILLITIIFFCLHSMSQSWTWQQFTWDGQIWMRSYNNNNGQFDFCIGGGGCIEQMRYVPNSYQHLLSPSYQGEQTDRVIQWTYWGINITDPNANVADQRFNIDQAGNHEGIFNETISVEIDSNLVDVFSVSRNQWFPILDSSFTAIIPSFTRYEMLEQGVLKVKKVVRVTDILFNGSNVGNYDLYLESWIPFKNSSEEFNAVAMGLDGNGIPNWWYLANYNIPRYSNTPAGNTNGYVVVYQNGMLSDKPVVAIVFGKNELQTYNTTATGSHCFNMMDWNNGIGTFPSMYAYGAQPGSFIEREFYIVPSINCDASFKSLIDSLENEVSSPKLYGPSYNFTGELLSITQNLIQNQTVTGVRTNQLDSLITSLKSSYIKTGINDESNVLNGLKIFPNPITDQPIKVEVPDTFFRQEALLKIYDERGCEIYAVKSANNKFIEINAQKLKRSGIYFFVLTNRNQHITSTVVKL